MKEFEERNDRLARYREPVTYENRKTTRIIIIITGMLPEGKYNANVAELIKSQHHQTLALPSLKMLPTEASNSSK